MKKSVRLVLQRRLTTIKGEIYITHHLGEKKKYHKFDGDRTGVEGKGQKGGKLVLQWGLGAAGGLTTSR